jgi:hypothetical protein
MQNKFNFANFSPEPNNAHKITLHYWALQKMAKQKKSRKNQESFSPQISSRHARPNLNATETVSFFGRKKFK